MNNELMPLPSLRKLLCCILACCLRTTRAANEIVVQKTLPLSCSGSWNVSSVSMYNVAYKWTHEHPLNDWLYTSMPQKTQSPEPLGSRITIRPVSAECAQISYGAVVHVPTRFSSYVPAQMLRTNVSKHVCVASRSLQETVVFSEILMLGSMTLTLEGTIDNHKRQASFSSSCDIRLPWFAIPLKLLIYDHIRRSMLEYMDILHDSLCDAPGTNVI